MDSLSVGNDQSGGIFRGKTHFLQKLASEARLIPGIHDGGKYPPGGAFPGTVSGGKPACRLLQQGQHALRYGVGLRQNRSAGLLQDLRTSQFGGFHGEVGIEDP